MKLQTFYSLVSLASGALAAPWVPVETPTRKNVPIGDGSPRQAYLYKQVTKPLDCGGDDESCSISKAVSESWSIGFSMGASTAGWTNAGFDVSKSVSTGENPNCSAGTGDSNARKTCVWQRTAFTVYEVQEYKYYESKQDPEEGEKIGEPNWIWSPNDDEVGYGWVCAHDDECGSTGDEWWGYMSREDTLWTVESNKGGPQDFVWSKKREDRWN